MRVVIVNILLALRCCRCCRVQPSSAPTRYTETVQMFCTSANFHAAMAHPRGYTYRQSNETNVVTERTVTLDHCHFSMEVFQVLHTNTAAKLFLLLPMKYRTRSPICTVTSGRLDTTLSLQNPSNPIVQNVTLICLQEWQPSPRVRASNTGSRQGKKEKKILTQHEEATDVENSNEGCFFSSHFYRRKKFLY